MENVENIMNEEVMDLVAEPTGRHSNVNFGAIGIGVLAAGAIAALGYKIYKTVKAKKAAESQYVYDTIPYDAEMCNAEDTAK